MCGGCVVMACGPKTSPPMPPGEPTPTVVTTQRPIHSEAHELDIPPQPAMPPAIAKECGGAELDVAKLVALPACRIDHTPLPVPATVTITLAPEPIIVKSGAKLDAAIVLTNTTDTEVVLVLDDVCDNLEKVSFAMLDVKGDRVDQADHGCGSGVQCTAVPLGLAIAPKGSARIPFVIEARIEEADAACSGKRVKPVRAGTYMLKVFSGLGELTSKVTVR